MDDAIGVATRHIQRSKSGCQQCRQRRKKCDEQHPMCRACLDRNLPCSWQRDEPKQPMARRRRQFNKDYMVPQEMRPHFVVFAAPSASIKETLMSHFCATAPLWITMGGEERRAACVDLIMPVAIRNPLVLTCVLALAAGDYGKYQLASSGIASLTHGLYGQAVLGIRSALDSELVQPGPSTSTGDDILLAVILLCMHESVNFSDTDRILPHINAAASLCHRRSFSTTPNSRLRGLLFEIFCYFFSLTAFSHGHKLRLDLAPQVFKSPVFADTCRQDILLGSRCREVFSIILKVATLTSGKAVSPDENVAAELRAIEAYLDDWLPPTPGQDDPIAREQAIVSELFRLACLIHVREIMGSQLAHQCANIQELVAEFIRHLGLLPHSSIANGILCWPLVVVGMSSLVGAHRRLIVGRLRKIHETWRSDILIKSADLLSQEWKQDSVSETSFGQNMEPSHLARDKRPIKPRSAFRYPVVLL